MKPMFKVLIVEDESTLAENIRAYLCRRHCDVLAVASGEAALEVAPTFRPDYAILDYGLPGINGVETHARLKSFLPQIGGLLISGNLAGAVLDEARAQGIGGVLVKPFSFGELAHFMDEHAPAISVEPETSVTNSRAGCRCDERRTRGMAAEFPLHTPRGCVGQERRRGDRRNAANHSHLILGEDLVKGGAAECGP